MKLIGKGLFTKAYLLPGGTVELHSPDRVKECMALGWFPKSRFFPKISLVDIGVYHTTYYPRARSLKNRLTKADYALYKELRDLPPIYGIPGKPWVALGKLEENFKTISDPELRDALLEALDGLVNYSQDIRFEISPRNVGVDENGGLVLLDCFFFADSPELNKGK